MQGLRMNCGIGLFSGIYGCQESRKAASFLLCRVPGVIFELLKIHVKMLLKSIALVAFNLAAPIAAQLATGYQLGPLTTSDAKWAVKVCDVTKYGAVADGVTDLGPPLLAAFNACKTGGVGKHKLLDTKLLLTI